MTRRRPAQRLLLAAGVLLALDVLLAAERAAHLLLLLAAVSGFAWLNARHRLPWQQARRVLPSQGHGKPRQANLAESLAIENAALRDEVDQLRADLQDARLQAAAAWDAASSVPPRPARPRPPAITRLLTDRMSGVRPLFPGDNQ